MDDRFNRPFHTNAEIDAEITRLDEDDWNKPQISRVFLFTRLKEKYELLFIISGSILFLVMMYVLFLAWLAEGYWAI